MEITKGSSKFRRNCKWDISFEKIMEIFKTLQRIDQEEFGITVYLLTPQAYGKTCHLLENSIHFLTDGTAIPCVGYHNLKYGNINSNSMSEIVQSPLRQVLIQPKKWIYGY